MQTIHVLEIQKIDVICEDNRGFDEKNLCLQLFSDASYSIPVRSCDFFYIWNMITNYHPRSYCHSRIHDIQENYFLMCIDDNAKIQKLITNLKELSMSQVYQALLSETHQQYRGNYLKCLENLKKVLLVSFQKAYDEHKGIVYYNDDY